jgi:methionine-gamma-lyase
VQVFPLEQVPDMKKLDPNFGLSTLVTHFTEGEDPRFSHVTPIYQSSVFDFPDVETGAGIFRGDVPGLNYTRWNNPNQQQLADKIAFIEGIDLLRGHPDRLPEQMVAGMVFSSGMAAISAVILSRVRHGQAVIAQKALYTATHELLDKLAPGWGIETIFLEDPTPEHWEEAFRMHPNAVLAYTETPANPTMSLTDLAAVADISHHAGAWLVVDNTFATPFCQRPLSLGADVVMHSTTKYLSGHGLIIGGAVASRHPEYIHKELFGMMKMLGGSESPFDAWLVNTGLKTFELRMQRHCENAMQVARFLEAHPAVEVVHYPGLESHPQHELAHRQMLHFGGMMSFELHGGLEAGARMMNRVRVATLAVSLGLVDTVVSHPASMTHSGLSSEARKAAGIREGLVRLSVGIENVEDLIGDLDQALK